MLKDLVLFVAGGAADVDLVVVEFGSGLTMDEVVKGWCFLVHDA